MSQHSANFFEVQIALIEGEDGDIVELLHSPYAARNRQDGLNRAAQLLADSEGMPLVDVGEPFTLDVRQPAQFTVRKPNRRRRLARVFGL